MHRFHVGFSLCVFSQIFSVLFWKSLSITRERRGTEREILPEITCIYLATDLILPFEPKPAPCFQARTTCLVVVFPCSLASLRVALFFRFPPGALRLPAWRWSQYLQCLRSISAPPPSSERSWLIPVSWAVVWEGRHFALGTRRWGETGGFMPCVCPQPGMDGDAAGALAGVFRCAV